MRSNLMSPIIDLYETRVSKVDKVDFKFVQIILNEQKSVDFFATLIKIKLDTS